MKNDRIPDAARSPLPFAGAGDSQTRLAKLQAEFSPVLKVPHVYVRHQGTEHFLSGCPGDTLGFPSHDPRSGLPRYDWADRGDGVLLGHLKPDV
ncbi:MAG: hypothetical protein LC745_01125 [Planctomycetia bacterium]|nr:hypothetical protein [Planctomycetia bacterium]